MDLVSILMPVRNAGTFLSECVQSILDQSYPNWELLAVDDHSTDASFSILQDFQKRDNRIKVLKNSGVGIIDALRLAYSNSSGSLITRMDADDTMRRNKLHVLVENLHRAGKGNIAIGMVHYFSETPLGAGYKEYERWLNRLTEKGNNFDEIYKECVIPSPCWMVYRKDLDRSDAFNPNIYPEDYDLCFRFYKYGLKPIACKEVLHNWRDYATRTSRTDSNYADNTFLELKLHYFLELEYNASRPLALWGAGEKGKKLARHLIKRGIPFFWICDNPKKIGKQIYGQVLLSVAQSESIKNAQTVVVVANKESKKEITNHFSVRGGKAKEDYFFFV